MHPPIMERPPSSIHWRSGKISPRRDATRRTSHAQWARARKVNSKPAQWCGGSNV